MQSELKKDGIALIEHHEQAINFQGLLREICNTMTMRIQAVASSVVTSEAAIASQQSATDEFLIAHDPIVHEINAIFDTLKAQAVDPVMVNGEIGKTLFDFVDSETVLSLQSDAQTQATLMQNLLSKLRIALDSIRSILCFYQAFDFQGIIESDLSSDDVWLNLTDFCYQLVDRTAQNIQRHTTLLEIPPNEAIQQESVLLVKSSQEAVDRLGGLYDIALEYFVDMEQCDCKIVENFNMMHDINIEYDAVYNATHALFDELRTLHDFYRQFKSSFLTLHDELARRKEYAQKHSLQVQEMQAILKAEEQQESNMRQAYAAEHLRFLPSSLITIVKEEPTKYTIKPSE
ncbi:hypothetical protein THRCLA_05231 [Thraustotheca clavata]|uniref:Autophagy-related protein 17 n=1 Tax=Thraustotheca clavata TaxID=74557 RepID=A0A1V9ZWP8_9STRA|nr:hypothetical protein THRCLA_05231 [Thraustotheca clavata]